MITAAIEELHAAGVTTPPEVVVADAGYWNGPHIAHLINQGIQTLRLPRSAQTGTPRRGRDGGLYAFMRRVLAAAAEPHATQNGDSSPQRRRPRALPATPSDDRPHNLIKLWRHQLAATSDTRSPDPHPPAPATANPAPPTRRRREAPVTAFLEAVGRDPIETAILARRAC
jgi:hypothetical protein